MLELKDGGKYVNRLGDVVTVFERLPRGDGYCFLSQDSTKSYLADGHYFGKFIKSDYDLVAEYKYPEDSISKAALVEYIRNRLAVLEQIECYEEPDELNWLAKHFNVDV